MRYLSFECNKGYLYIIAYWLAEIFGTIFKILMTKSKKSPNSNDYDNEKNFHFEEELLKLLYGNLSDLLFGFLVLYTILTMKRLEKEKKERKKISEKN
jgi:hypothetical protein